MSRSIRDTLECSVPSFKRLFGFSIVGGFVFVFGTFLLYLLVEIFHLEKVTANLVDGIVSIELCFFLNKFFNWKDRRGNLSTQWLKFHAGRAGTFAFNQVIFIIMVNLGIYYLLVGVFTTGITTILNFLLNDLIVFNKNRSEGGQI